MSCDGLIQKERHRMNNQENFKGGSQQLGEFCCQRHLSTKRRKWLNIQSYTYLRIFIINIYSDEEFSLQKCMLMENYHFKNV